MLHTKTLTVREDRIFAETIEAPAQTDEERRMSEAGFEAIGLPMDRIPFAQANGAPVASVRVDGRDVTFSDLGELDIVLLELDATVQQITAKVQLREYQAPVPYIPSPVRNLFTAARNIMPGRKCYVLFLPEWQPAPRDPIALYGDLSDGHLWKIGQWNGFEEAKKLDELLRKPAN
jgi:hypothetical protein